MRDIKFRYYDCDLHVMLPNDYPIAITSKGFIYDLSKNTEKPYISQLKPLNVNLKAMQFTELTDKNGVDIYEGDLLRIPAESSYENTTYNCFEVFYHSNECIGGLNVGFCINRMHTQGNSAGGRGYKFTPESIAKNGFVVMGNIYQDKELLSD